MSSIEENMNIYQEGALLKRKKEKKKVKKANARKKEAANHVPEVKW